MVLAIVPTKKEMEILERQKDGVISLENMKTHELDRIQRLISFGFVEVIDRQNVRVLVTKEELESMSEKQSLARTVNRKKNYHRRQIGPS